VRSHATAVCANKFGQSAAAGAPPADLFNIWRDDYMITPAEAATEVSAHRTTPENDSRVTLGHHLYIHDSILHAQ